MSPRLSPLGPRPRPVLRTGFNYPTKNVFTTVGTQRGRVTNPGLGQGHGRGAAPPSPWQLPAPPALPVLPRALLDTPHVPPALVLAVPGIATVPSIATPSLPGMSFEAVHLSVSSQAEFLPFLGISAAGNYAKIPRAGSGACSIPCRLHPIPGDGHSAGMLLPGSPPSMESIPAT